MANDRAGGQELRDLAKKKGVSIWGAPVVVMSPQFRFMAKALKAKGYEYQYLFCRNSGHGIRNAKAQFLPHAFEWVWKGYGSRKIK